MYSRSCTSRFSFKLNSFCRFPSHCTALFRPPRITNTPSSVTLPLTAASSTLPLTAPWKTAQPAKSIVWSELLPAQPFYFPFGPIFTIPSALLCCHIALCAATERDKFLRRGDKPEESTTCKRGGVWGRLDDWSIYLKSKSTSVTFVRNCIHFVRVTKPVLWLWWFLRNQLSWVELLWRMLHMCTLCARHATRILHFVVPLSRDY